MGEPTKRRREAWIRRTNLLSGIPWDGAHYKLKWAETVSEQEQASSLVHDEYLRLRYLSEPTPSKLHFSIHNHLPNSTTMVMKRGTEIISTLSRTIDDPCFSLSMDTIYRDELDALREHRRQICEFCSLATARGFQHRNLFMYLFRTMYLDAEQRGLDDVCIMVNPKHVPFYKTILLFEALGPERHYPRLRAPAVALRLDVAKYEENMRAAYEGFEPRNDLYRFVYGWRDLAIQDYGASLGLEGRPEMNEASVRALSAFSPLHH